MIRLLNITQERGVIFGTSMNENIQYKNNVQWNTEVYNCLSSDHIWPSFLQLLPLAKKISSSNFCVATQFDFRDYHEWMMNCGGWAWFTEALGEESLFHQSTCRWLSRSQARCGSTKATDVWSDMEVGQLIPNLKFYSCQAWEEQENFEFQLPQLLCQSTNRSSEKYLNVSLGWQMKCEWHESWTWKIIVLHCLWSHTHGYHGLNEIFVGISWKVSMPHTVQAYSLLDPAPTYGNTNFSDLSNSVNTWNWEVEVEFFFLSPIWHETLLNRNLDVWRSLFFWVWLLRKLDIFPAATGSSCGVLSRNLSRCWCQTSVGCTCLWTCWPLVCQWLKDFGKTQGKQMHIP